MAGSTAENRRSRRQKPPSAINLPIEIACRGASWHIQRVHRTSPVLLIALLLSFVTRAHAATTVESYAKKVSSLISPAKLKTLRERGANPRVQKYVALLAQAKHDGIQPEMVAKEAAAAAGMTGEAAALTAATMVRNLVIAERLGCLNSDGLWAMRHGQSPTVRLGSCRGDELSVDHIIPLTVAPELDKVIANLELMPLKLNESKNGKVGARQIDLAKKLNRAGLLTRPTLEIILATAR